MFGVSFSADTQGGHTELSLQLLITHQEFNSKKSSVDTWGLFSADAQNLRVQCLVESSVKLDWFSCSAVKIPLDR